MYLIDNFFYFFFCRVKDAIVKKEEVVTQIKQQYHAAQKRADHLEGLLQQQRKQLLGK
jgi:5-azacytidine-induced protein 1